MNLIETGKYIKQCRKSNNLTQSDLAEKLNISEKTISKWECGNGFPDTSLILPLCNILNISANELLSAKNLTTTDYKQCAENNLIQLKAEQEKSSKHLLTIEYALGYIALVSFIIMILMASFIEMQTYLRILLILVGIIEFSIALFFCVKIERDAGFYECQKCHHKYIPTYKAVLFSMHMGRTRFLKCPKCHKKSWNKKTINY